MKTGIKILFAAILLAIVVKIFAIEAFTIPTTSMEKTLLAGDFIIVNKLFYGASTGTTLPVVGFEVPSFRFPFISEYKRGDVVVFKSPGGKNEIVAKEKINYVKRIIGLPGDTIQIINDELFVNGTVRREPYLENKKEGKENSSEQFSDLFPGNKSWNENNFGPIVVPRKGMKVEINHDNIDDWKLTIERELGFAGVFVSKKQIKIDGKPAFNYTFKYDHYFVLGDNRDDSMDSRFWGFVKDDQLIGRAMLVYYSVNDEKSTLLSAIRFDRIFKVIE